MQEAEPLFLSEQHPLSKRHVVLEDDGQTIWLYLTLRDSVRPVTDVWVYNRVERPGARVTSSAPSPPPATAEFLGDTGRIEFPLAHDWSFVWSADGEAVAVVMDGKPVAFVRSQQKPGLSRQLSQDGPYGHVWSEDEYQATFGVG